MAAPCVERRLAAILCADVVGYSRLMGRDETGTFQRLKTCREGLISLLTTEHGGRIVNTIGDSALCEFASVTAAVECAMAIRRGMAERERGLPEEERIRFRIGVHVGDVIHDDGDLYGDGVNVAARLEQLCEPGGVLVSSAAYDHLRGKLSRGFECLGERRLKNIDRPVRIYRLIGEAETAPEVGSVPPPGQPSIAVLPFDDLGSGPGGDCFGDGISEDLVVALSRFRNLTVLTRSSSLAFGGRPADVAELGRRLGAHFLLGGSVRRAGERIRITAQLIDPTTDACLWAEHYDRPLGNILAVQDKVVATLAATLAGRVEAARAEQARRKPIAELTADDCLRRGMEHLAGYGRNANAKAHAMFERAIDLDPALTLALT